MITCIWAEEADKCVAYPFNCMDLPIAFCMNANNEMSSSLSTFLPSSWLLLQSSTQQKRAILTNSAARLCLTYCNSEELCRAELGLENSLSGWQQHMVMPWWGAEIDLKIWPQSIWKVASYSLRIALLHLLLLCLFPHKSSSPYMLCGREVICTSYFVLQKSKAELAELTLRN